MHKILKFEVVLMNEVKGGAFARELGCVKGNRQISSTSPLCGVLVFQTKGDESSNRTTSAHRQVFRGISFICTPEKSLLLSETH